MKLTSPYGEVEVRALVSDTVKGKRAVFNDEFYHRPPDAVNRLTSSYHDRITPHTPNYKEMSVNMVVLEAKGRIDTSVRKPSLWSPVFHKLGIKVEEKWNRTDYVPIPELIDNGGDQHGQSNPQH